MIYRIDFQTFLTHAIDYFPMKTLAYEFHYYILSEGVRFGGKITNGAKGNVDLYPTFDFTYEYVTGDYKSFEKAYHEWLDRKPDGGKPITDTTVAIHKGFLEPHINHISVVIVCDKNENYLVDAFCSYLKKKYGIEVIDLNRLFKEGHIGPISIDYNYTHDKYVDINRKATLAHYYEKLGSAEGRLFILKRMTKKDKLKKLKELGIRVTNKDEKELDALLMEAFVIGESEDE